MADDRTYIRVHDGLYEHPKVAGLSDAAFRLLVESWCYCSRNRTDGRIADAIWKRRGTPKARRELLDVGLAEQRDGAVEMHDYLEHQRSAEEIRLLQEVRGDSGTYGAHVRWHVVKRKPKPGCEHCPPGDGPDGKPIANAIANGWQTDSKTMASTEAEAEAENKYSPRGGTHVSRGTAPTPPRFPTHCAAHANTPTPGKCGDCADARIAHETQPPPDYRLRVVPPLCGECDDRWIDTPDGIAHCPRCHPAEVRTA